MASKIDAALAFTQKIVDSGALYFRANPAVTTAVSASISTPVRSAVRVVATMSIIEWPTSRSTVTP